MHQAKIEFIPFKPTDVITASTPATTITTQSSFN